jgi:hypothetical protein
MSTPLPPKPAKLVIGFLLKNRELAGGVIHELAHRFGPPDLISPWFEFGYTDYYEKEIGSPLARRLLAFKSLICQTDLADIKIATNSIEEHFSEGGRRQVNIDPGYLLMERFVLATGKNFSHRIYIGHGIYADLTLIYSGGQYQVLPWTYPDYAGEEIRKILEKIREKYKIDLKSPENSNLCEDLK